MGHVNHVEMLTCLVNRPEPSVHPETGRVTAVLHVQVGTKAQTVRAEFPPVGGDDSAPRAALGLAPGTYVHLKGRLATRNFTHDLYDDIRRVRYCPFCGEPYASGERSVYRSREVLTCAACRQPFVVARRRTHTLVTVTELAPLGGGPAQRLPRGRACSSTVSLLGVLLSPALSTLRPQTGLIESRFQLTVYRPGGPRKGVDYPWVYVLPFDGHDGLAKSVRGLVPGDPVFVQGELRARQIRDRNLVQESAPAYCPGCRGALASAATRRDDRAESLICGRCQLEVPIAYRSRVVDVVATSVEFLKHVQEYTYTLAGTGL